MAYTQGGIENRKARTRTGQNYEKELEVNLSHLEERRRRHCQRSTGVEMLQESLELQGGVLEEELRGDYKDVEGGH